LDRDFLGIERVRPLQGAFQPRVSGEFIFPAGPQKQLAFVPLALVMFFHAIYLTIFGSLRRSAAALTQRELLGGATA